MTDTGHHARWAAHLASYGADSLNTTIDRIEVELRVVTARAANPNAYPTVTRPVDPSSTACRLVGILLDYGWTPPTNGATANE